MDNKKETLYTFKFTESELTELEGILDRSTIYFSDDPNINKYINLFHEKREKIIKKRDNYIKKLQKQIEKKNKKNND
tara:strand:+ start:3615 stop:3845 length:231 start_codon:yes stop_codon:yes gene_type:complete